MRNPLPSGLWILLAMGLIAMEPSAVSPVRAQANPELNALLTQGVAFPGGQTRKIRPPSMVDGLDAAGQRKVIDAIMAMKIGRPINFGDFTKNNLNAPFVLLIDEDPTYDGNLPGHSVNLWFVVHGELKTVADPTFLKNQFKPDESGRTDTLSAADLQQRQIVPRIIPEGSEGFVHGKFRMLDKDVRVEIQATERIVRTTTKESATVAGQIDRRFDSDAKFPNEWRSVTQGVVSGTPILYFSHGSYAKVTKLIAPAGALLVDYHFVYDEPEGWFNGANLLRSKLRAKTEGDVRTFRRQVKVAESGG